MLYLKDETLVHQHLKINMEGSSHHPREKKMKKDATDVPYLVLRVYHCCKVKNNKREEEMKF